MGLWFAIDQVVICIFPMRTTEYSKFRCVHTYEGRQYLAGWLTCICIAACLHLCFTAWLEQGIHFILGVFSSQIF